MLDPDALIWGAKAIAAAANIVDEDGEPDERRAFYLLGKGLLPARKVGRLWVSTVRRIRSIATD
jgi:hypothetical protein